MPQGRYTPKYAQWGGQRKKQYWQRGGAARVAAAAARRTVLDDAAYSAAGAGARAVRRNEKKKIEKTLLQMHEPKYYYQTVYNGVEMANDTPVVQLTQPTVGNNADEREGDKIFHEHLKIRAVVTKEADNGDELCRILIIRWKMDNAHDTPVLADIVESTLFGTANCVQAPYTVDHSRRAKFEVIWDKQFVMTQQNGPASVLAKKMFIAQVPLKRMFKFEDAGQTGQGNLYAFCLSNYTAAARASPILMLQTVLQFRDV